jgi:allophanate hydrolase
MEPLLIGELRDAINSGAASVADLAIAALRRAKAYADPAVWITLFDEAFILNHARQAETRRAGGAAMPLLGIPFAVKDNIDVAGAPTTAACPAYAYTPARSATAVQRLIDAGAIPIGKTNLDQFATGLVGTRSPYGACRNAFDPRFISGGSSSGSAIAVAGGIVPFSLGTDTAGSGRVPAMFNNIVGLKPTRGLVSTTGVVPACRTLDCVSIFALTCADAMDVLRVIAGPDDADPFSRKVSPDQRNPSRGLPRPFRFGVPATDELEFFGDTESAAHFTAAVERLRSLGGIPVTIDYCPFRETAELLYGGPWVAERYWVVRQLLKENPDALLPVTRQIIEAATHWSAVDTFDALYRLESLRRRAETEWTKMDVFLLPTAGTIYTIEQVEADPIRLNANLGRYTNFVNFLDLCAVAVPNAFRADGLPTGITLIGPAGMDSAVIELADAFHRTAGLPLGATGRALPEHGGDVNAPPRVLPSPVRLAVVGAHLSGQPLNHQLTDRGATLVRACRTAPHYRLFALPGTTPPKPGLIRLSPGMNGSAIEVEVWEMTAEAFGSFVAMIPPPLGIGSLTLEDGEVVKGFLCESYAIEGARDISTFGGWRSFLAGT